MTLPARGWEKIAKIVKKLVVYSIISKAMLLHVN
jgi:hypothetical protein